MHVERGVDVTVVESGQASRCWPSLGREAVGEVFAELCTVSTAWTCGSTASGRGDHRRRAVQATGSDGCGDGSTVAADAVLVAVGAKPNIRTGRAGGA